MSFKCLSDMTDLNLWFKRNNKLLMSYFWSNKHNVDLYEQDKHMQSKQSVYDMKHDFTNGNRVEQFGPAGYWRQTVWTTVKTTRAIINLMFGLSTTVSININIDYISQVVRLAQTCHISYNHTQKKIERDLLLGKLPKSRGSSLIFLQRLKVATSILARSWGLPRPIIKSHPEEKLIHLDE